MKDQYNLVGKTVCGDWFVCLYLTCKEYKEVYEAETGDTSKIIKNGHYVVYNTKCDFITYIDASTLIRNVRRGSFSRCARCDGAKCYYKTSIRVWNPVQVMEGRTNKIPDRSVIKSGDVINGFNVLDIYHTTGRADHSLSVWATDGDGSVVARPDVLRGDHFDIENHDDYVANYHAN